MKFVFTLAIISTTFFANGQTNSLRVNSNIVLPKDSIESKILTSSLNEFLLSIKRTNEENKFVVDTEKTETFIQLDEVKGIEKGGKYKDDFFYKPYLTNIVLLQDNTYLIQVSYIGTTEDFALLRASFEFVAHKVNNSFVFSSPLLRNTANWKVKKVRNNIFHYQSIINKREVKKFNDLTSTFDSKLKSTDKITDYYCCDNIIELQKLIGIDYKSDYNGRATSVWSSSFGDKKLVLLGNNNSTFNYFDPHDLFHDRLSLVTSRNKLNKPVDEGCAYIYGGSWGLTWKEIFKAFKEQIASNKTTNWREAKETSIYFKTKNYSNSVDYIVNALLVQKIEKEKGFAGVWELLNVGPFEKGNIKYYATLEKLIGITKENYNDKVWELISDEK